MTRRTLFIILLVFGCLFFVYKLADRFSSGSYGHAERYELGYSEEKIIEAIKKLKDEDKDLLVPKVTIQNSGQWNLDDGKENETDYWYKFYFYDKKKNQILFTLTRPTGPNTTTFAFVSVNNGLDIGHWNDINDDFGFLENGKILKNFEETILKRIKNNLSD